MRSLLVVPAAREDLASALQTGADAVVVDLPPTADAALLAVVRDFLASVADEDTRPLVLVRIAAANAPDIDTTLTALMPSAPDGFVIGNCGHGVEVQQLAVKLAVLEAELDYADGQTAIIAEIGAAARALLVLDSFVGCCPRLLALAWSPQAFAAELGADSRTTGPCLTGRHLVLATARAAEVGAIAWDLGLDDAAFEVAIQVARQDGFNAGATDAANQIARIDTAFRR